MPNGTSTECHVAHPDGWKAMFDVDNDLLRSAHNGGPARGRFATICHKQFKANHAGQPIKEADFRTLMINVRHNGRLRPLDGAFFAEVYVSPVVLM